MKWLQKLLHLATQDKTISQVQQTQPTDTDFDTEQFIVALQQLMNTIAKITGVSSWDVGEWTMGDINELFKALTRFSTQNK